MTIEARHFSIRDFSYYKDFVWALTNTVSSVEHLEACHLAHRLHPYLLLLSPRSDEQSSAHPIPFITSLPDSASLPPPYDVRPRGAFPVPSSPSSSPSPVNEQIIPPPLLTRTPVSQGRKSRLRITIVLQSPSALIVRSVDLETGERGREKTT